MAERWTQKDKTETPFPEAVKDIHQKLKADSNSSPTVGSTADIVSEAVPTTTNLRERRGLSMVGEAI